MKKVILIYLFFPSYFAFGQIEIPFFEQLALDFYKDSILPKYPLKKKLKTYKYTMDSHPKSYKFYVPECLTGKYMTEGKELELFSTYVLEQMDWDSPNYELKYVEKDQKTFKIKRNSGGKKLKLLITPPYFEKNNCNFFYLNIIEKYKRKDIIYHLKFSDKGKVLKWCRTEMDWITVY